jgi:hypothetical protein
VPTLSSALEIIVSMKTALILEKKQASGFPRLVVSIARNAL